MEGCGGGAGIPPCSCDLLTGVARPRVKVQDSYHGNTGLELLVIEKATNSAWRITSTVY